MSKNKTTSSGKAQEPSRLLESFYTPDILTCLANLSNDEVFTPPEVANAMLDLLPKELFSNPDVTFLDPACKSGIFLREAAKRLLKGLEKEIPDLQQRLDHIFKKQLFGIALTRLTSLLSRRTVYCSKFPNEKYSLCQFDTEQGNIQYKRLPHKWKDGQCEYCGAPQSEYKRGSGLENYAYNFIHVKDIKKLQGEFPMKFDVVIGNPPYQISDGGAKASARPIYHLFVQQAIKLNPKYLSMIIPSRWFAGGKGLNAFRSLMLSDKHIKFLKDYTNSRDCFPGVDIAGGICYFLWDKSYNGNCTVENVLKDKTITSKRLLGEFDTFIRYAEAIDIIKKIKALDEGTMECQVSSRKPFGLDTTTQFDKDGDLTLRSSKGIGKYSSKKVSVGVQLIDKWKTIISYVSYDHAGQPDKDGKRKVMSVIEVLPPKAICTETYLLAGVFDNERDAVNLKSYLSTKFVRFLVAQVAVSQHITKSCFSFVPLQDFSKSWTDEELYKKYGLTDEEIAFIESTIKPMDAEG